jgi:4-hydroxy-3-methylbut-2-enyl diphosphate reductase
VARLERKGLKIINHETLATLRSEKVLIRAHGEPPSTYALAMANQLELIDASCPVVLKLQNRIRNTFDKGSQIYIFGKPGHAEVEGLLGQTDQKAVVFQDVSELDLTSLPTKISLYSQTTKSKDKFYATLKAMREAGIEVEANDTICRQVSNRDSELRAFAARFDVVVFVSGKKSSNGKVLYQVCQAVNPRTYFVSSAAELDFAWFNDTDRIGICGATSTPMWLMEQVQSALLAG